MHRETAHVGATAWAAAAALWLTLLWQPKWWHPDCALRGDGPIAYLAGYPLPFVEPSRVTSMEWFIAPVPLAIDLFLIGAAVLIFPRKSGRGYAALRSASAGLM